MGGLCPNGYDLISARLSNDLWTIVLPDIGWHAL